MEMVRRGGFDKTLFFIALILVAVGVLMVFDASGNLLAEAKAFQEDLLIVDTDNTASLPFKPLDPIEALHEALVLGLRDYTRKCGFKSVVLGLSTGTGVMSLSNGLVTPCSSTCHRRLKCKSPESLRSR